MCPRDEVQYTSNDAVLLPSSLLLFELCENSTQKDNFNNTNNKLFFISSLPL